MCEETDFGVDCLFKLAGKAKILPVLPFPLKLDHWQVEVCIGTVLLHQPLNAKQTAPPFYLFIYMYI